MSDLSSFLAIPGCLQAAVACCEAFASTILLWLQAVLAAGGDTAAAAARAVYTLAEGKGEVRARLQAAGHRQAVAAREALRCESQYVF